MGNYGHLGGVGEDLGGCQLVEGSTEVGSGREGKARHAWSVGLRTAGRLSEWDTLDPTWRSGSNLLVEKMFTVLCSYTFMCIPANLLAP